MDTDLVAAGSDAAVVARAGAAAAAGRSLPLLDTHEHWEQD